MRSSGIARRLVSVHFRICSGRTISGRVITTQSSDPSTARTLSVAACRVLNPDEGSGRTLW